MGAVAFNDEGHPIAIGSNAILQPRFDSQAHAEMVAMNKLERRADRDEITKYTLITSLEPCPMCFSRLLTSGIEKVWYLAADDEGGMVQNRDKLPAVWQTFGKNRTFSLVEGDQNQEGVRSQMKAMAIAIFDKTKKVIDEDLVEPKKTKNIFNTSLLS